MGLETDDTILESDFEQTSSGAENKVPKTNADGEVDISFFPQVGARVYHSTTQTVNSTPSAVAFDSENFDTNAFHDTSTNNSRLTIPSGAGGLYLIGGSVNPTGAQDIEIVIRKNGTTHLAGCVSDAGMVAVSTLVELSAADYVEIIADNKSSSTTAQSGENTNFWITRLA